MTQQKFTAYLIKADAPYPGHVESLLLKDGTVAWTDGETLAQYEARKGYKMRQIGPAELDKLSAEFIASQITDPVEISEERFWDMLEILPPCKWRTVRGVEMFHISERLSHDLVSWFAHVNGRYFEFVDRDSRPAAEIADKVGTAL